MTVSQPLAAPSFDLPGVDGTRHALGDYAGSELLAVVQWCNHCPYVQAWEGRLNEIAAEYAGRDVAVVAVSSNDAVTHPDDAFPEMAKRAQAQGYRFDYLYDEDQSLARALGSERTPEVFLFDRDRTLVYHGAIDDDRDGDAITRHYLRDALEAALEGRAVDPADTPPVGCSVKWKP